MKQQKTPCNAQLARRGREGISGYLASIGNRSRTHPIKAPARAIAEVVRARIIAFCRPRGGGAKNAETAAKDLPR